MLFPAKMKETCIIGLKEEKESILETIQDFGYSHLKEIQLPLGVEQPGTEEEIAALSRINRLLEKIESMEIKKSNFLESIFGSSTTIEKIPDKISLNTIDDIEKSINENIAALKQLEIEIKELEELNELLLKLKGTEIDFSFLKSSKTIKAILAEVDIEQTKNLQKILDQFNYTIFEIDRFSKKKDFVKTISHVSESNLVRELTQHLLKEYSMENLIGKPKEQLKEVYKRLNKLKEVYKKSLKEFLVKSGEWKRSLNITKGFLLNLKERKDVEAYLRSTEKTFILCGWVPEKYLNQLKFSLKNFNCWLNFEEVQEAPVLFENPRILKPFESFVKNYGYPQYKSLDPTFILALTIPIFFGFMMGDVVYGISLLTISLLLKRYLKNKTTEWLASIAIFYSIFTILFGILFGSYAGFGFQPLWLNIQEKPAILLVIALYIGIIHINIGLTLNMINGIKIRDLKTVFDSISWFLIQFSIISGVMVIFGFFEISKTFLLIPLILGFGIRLFIRNLFGLMDIPGFFGNLLSYSRLMIIVLTSTYIAFIINLGTQMLWKNYIPLAIGIFVIGHAFNFLLGVLGAGINSLRLHYIEFFGRFFESKGMEYKPFRKILSVEVI